MDVKIKNLLELPRKTAQASFIATKTYQAKRFINPFK